MFEGPRLKVNRADQHISDLNALFETLKNGELYTIFAEEQPNPRGKFYSLGVRKIAELPCKFPLILGDAIHNLRTALDLAMCEMVIADKGKPTHRTRFQFAETAKKLETTLQEGSLQCLKPDIVRTIVDKIRPYDAGGDNALLGLHALDIRDKHTLLIPVLSIAEAHIKELLAVSDEFGVLSTWRSERWIIGADNVLHAQGFGVPVPVQFKFQGQYAIPTDVIFDRGQAFEGKSVIPTLHQLSQLVRGILDTLERTFLARAQKVV
jgi:hypothetical protein